MTVHVCMYVCMCIYKCMYTYFKRPAAFQLIIFQKVLLFSSLWLEGSNLQSQSHLIESFFVRTIHATQQF